jgi:hypothetical protein
MIRFEPVQPMVPEETKEIQWAPAIAAGLIAGAVLLLVPRGSPWEALTFFSPTIMGRSVASSGMPLMLAWLIHLGVSLVYGLVISRAVAHLRFEKGLLGGAIMGAVLYIVNFGVVSAFWPEIRGNEFPVIFTHVVFGLLSAGAYRGLLRRKAPVSTPP